MTHKDRISSNPTLTPDQRSMAERLSPEHIRRIDQTLLSNASTAWSQTSRIVLTTMIELDNGMGLPKAYFVDRVAHLVQEGHLEAKGDGGPPTEVRLRMAK